jgi:hypothetical protein
MTPTTCRIVHYWPTSYEVGAGGLHAEDKQPMAAMIVFVHKDGTVNLSVFDHWGHVHPINKVMFVTDNPEERGVATWPPRT